MCSFVIPGGGRTDSFLEKKEENLKHKYGRVKGMGRRLKSLLRVKFGVMPVKRIIETLMESWRRV